ncbi:hypothetical protein [Nocardia rhizosphaerae]|uniref:Uncharacterized protein n=1 Tax=Nocardia rhizosphaerae TaxID=1691571 RepID=A0ABV8LD09_9NOCA
MEPTHDVLHRPLFSRRAPLDRRTAAGRISAATIVVTVKIALTH